MKTKCDSLIVRALHVLIGGYACFISPLLGYNCRFYPTCSAYARLALARHGAGKGLFLALRRVLKCHPWSRAPYTDPVPEQFAWREAIGYKRCIRDNKKTASEQKTIRDSRDLP